MEEPTTRSPPPLTEEPEAKKPKMSTTGSDDEDSVNAVAKKPRYKRRKIAIFLAYCGVGYQGMQKNPGAKTIEGDLEEALFAAGGVPDHDRHKPQRYDWARSARTDKGVSAVGQVVSGRFYLDPPGFVDRLNSLLSPQIRIFGFKRVTGSFNAKKFCDRRRYVYLVPVFCLDPSAHPNRESVQSSLGSENELVKCLECSERGRKVEGLMGKRSYELRGMSFESVVSSNSSGAKEGSAVNGDDNETEKVSCDAEEGSVVNGDKIGIEAENANKKESSGAEEGSAINGDKIEIEAENEKEKESSGAEEASAINGDKNETEKVSFDAEEGSAINGDKHETEATDKEEKVEGEEMGSKRSEFRYGESEKERFNRILKSYEGTHNFHNFTARTKAEDPAANRFIISFNANTVVTVDGMDFVKCEVVGQSFMLHQIRKMIGLAVAIMRNCAPESLLVKALRKDINITVPTAPEVGLYLDECFFSSYNQKWEDTHEEISMKAYEEEAENFKMKFIYPHVASTEYKEGVAGLWLHSLNHRNYPDLRSGEDEIAPDSCANEADNKAQA